LAKAALPQTAREVARHDLVHQTPPAAVAALEALLPHALDPLVERVEETVEPCLSGIPRLVDPAGDLHAQPQAGGRVAGMKGGDVPRSDLPTTRRV
jgi:hypothetical protein